jgi:predicted negative regulator of RcsB-dependent stress response
VNDYRTEEEQLEALKRWWQENGKAIVIGIVLAAAAVFGWKAWQDHTRNVGEAASDAYFDLLDAVALSEQSPTAANKATATHLIKQLKSDYESSTYAQYAGLLAAKQAVLDNDLPLAEKELEWVLTQGDDKRVVNKLAKLRLARVIAAQPGDDNARRALALIENTEAGGFSASYEEVKGDIYLRLNRLDDARKAYAIAISEVERSGLANPVLTMKLEDLAVAGGS